MIFPIHCLHRWIFIVYFPLSQMQNRYGKYLSTSQNRQAYPRKFNSVTFSFPWRKSVALSSPSRVEQVHATGTGGFASFDLSYLTWKHLTCRPTEASGRWQQHLLPSQRAWGARGEEIVGSDSTLNLCFNGGALSKIHPVLGVSDVHARMWLGL